MKYILIPILLSLFSFTGFSQNGDSEEGKVNWMKISEALEKNEENPRKIFIDVYTDWCGWCTKMDNTTFRDGKIAELLNNHFYPVKFDAESSEPIEFKGNVYKNPNPGGRRSAHELASALLRNKLSYPSYVLLDEKKNGLTVLKGYMKEDQMLPILKYIGKDIYEEMEWKEYKQRHSK